MLIIDWHSHILPAVDDGSRDVNESIELLQLLAEQGVDTVVATPHFNADKESVSEFIKRRKASYNRLLKKAYNGMPDVRLGAEVEYYSGISHLTDLKALCIENTDILLLEMPISSWQESTVKELVNIVTTKGITLILAHIERMIKMQSSGVIEQLVQSGVLMQVNASFFAELRTRRKALSLLKRGCIQLLGSDCHSILSRPPKLGKAYEVIKNNLGEDFFVQMNEYGESVLEIN